MPALILLSKVKTRQHFFLTLSVYKLLPAIVYTSETHYQKNTKSNRLLWFLKGNINVEYLKN